MDLPILPTTVVGSYPQPDWLVNREMLSKTVPRTRMKEIWRVDEAFLEQAQDDATLLAIRDMEAAGIDIVTDGEIRRESYSNRFATALEGMDLANPGKVATRGGRTTEVPRIVGRIRRTRPVEVRDMEFLRRHTTRAATPEIRYTTVTSRIALEHPRARNDTPVRVAQVRRPLLG